MHLLLLVALLAVIGPDTAFGRRGGRSGKQKKSGAVVPSWVTDGDTLPISCDDDEFASRMADCVIIWQNYCKCEHCGEICEKYDWPLHETTSWKRKLDDDGWKNMKQAWKWSGECARNRTSQWRTFCSEVRYAMNTSDPHSFNYWFLIDLNRKSQVPELCQTHECAKREKTSATTARPPIDMERDEEATTKPRKSDKNLDILEALGPDQDELPKPCNRDELTRLLQRCTFIWQAYCSCKGCNQTCTDEWPPQGTTEWGSYGRVVGWESQDTAWQWAGKCAYNATNLWRAWCGDGTPEAVQNGTSGKEHEYWFLTELRADTHSEMVKALCEKKECWKWKEMEINTPPPSITTPGGAHNRSTSENWHVSEVVPRWAYALIAALVAVLILLLLAIVSAYCYRKSPLNKETKNAGKNLRGQTSPRGRRTTDNSTSWPQTSFAFFGTQALPGVGVDDSIYHTIGEAPLPTSPVFSFESFSPKTRKRFQRERSARSVKNVLYHDTVPATQQSESAPGATIQHAYEDTTPLPGAPSAMPPLPTTPPYFVPISQADVPSPTCEYDTLGEMGDSGQSNVTEEMVIGKEERANEEGVGSSNYDHIKLI